MGAPTDDAGHLPAPVNYELGADYSTSTLDGSLFPTTVTDFGSVDSLVLYDLILFGDRDGFAVNAPGYWSLGPWDFAIASEDRTRKRRSAHCLSDGSSSGAIRCETDEDLSSFMTTSSGEGPDGSNQSGPQSPNLPGPNAPFGRAYLSAEEILSLEMMAAWNSSMAWPSDVIQGAFPPTCGACDVTPPVVAGAFAPASNFVNLNGSPNFDPTADPLFSASFWDPSLTQQGPSVPEIPLQAMLLIGFAGLALVGKRRPSVRLG
jgi:hypothetical protein